VSGPVPPRVPGSNQQPQEGVWLESESSPLGELWAEIGWKILESFGKVALGHIPRT